MLLELISKQQNQYLQDISPLFLKNREGKRSLEYMHESELLVHTHACLPNSSVVCTRACSPGTGISILLAEVHGVRRCTCTASIGTRSADARGDTEVKH